RGDPRWTRGHARGGRWDRELPRFRPRVVHHRSDRCRQRRRSHALTHSPIPARRAADRWRSRMTNDTLVDAGSLRLQQIRDVDDPQRDAPDADFVARMREQFPTEAEYDRMLTRKAESRADARQAPSTLEELRAALDAFLDANVEGPHRVDD